MYASRDRGALLIAERVGMRRIVVQCCERAAGAGIRAGLSVSEALALLPAARAHVEEHTPERTSAALRATAIWARRFSPMIAVDEPDGLLIDVTGAARVFGGEEQLAQRVTADSNQLGLRACAVVASTFTCARAVARWGTLESTHTGVIADGAERAALVNLPVRALGIEEEAVEGLSEVGVQRLGQLMELSRSALPARFGQEVVRRLDEALGQAIEAIKPVRLVAPPCVERLFDGPTTQWEAIALTTRLLLESLCKALLARESGARLIQIDMGRSDAPPERLSIPLSAPSRDVRHLWSLVRPRLERMNMGFGVEHITIRAPCWGKLRHEQVYKWREDSPDADRETQRLIGELVDTLANRMGAERVVFLQPADSHIPERAFAARSAAGVDGSRSSAAPSSETPGVGDRPFTLFEKPKEASVMSLTFDGPALSVRFDGTEHHIVSCIGPERIGGEWWRGDVGERDYFKIQDAHGRWLWLCRACASGRWFVHGAW